MESIPGVVNEAAIFGGVAAIDGAACEIDDGVGGFKFAPPGGIGMGQGAAVPIDGAEIGVRVAVGGISGEDNYVAAAGECEVGGEDLAEQSRSSGQDDFAVGEWARRRGEAFIGRLRIWDRVISVVTEITVFIL